MQQVQGQPWQFSETVSKQINEKRAGDKALRESPCQDWVSCWVDPSTPQMRKFVSHVQFMAFWQAKAAGSVGFKSLYNLTTVAHLFILEEGSCKCVLRALHDRDLIAGGR